MGVLPTRMMPLGAWRKSAPPLPYDAEVEYVEANGAQWVDTGASLASGSFRCKALFLTSVTSSFALGVQGNATSGSTASKRLLFFAGSNGGYIDRGTAGGRISFTVDAAPYDSGKVPFAIVLDTAKTIYICDANGISGNRLLGRIYAAQFWDAQDTLVRDLISVRVGTTGYLYDRANPKGGPLGNGLYGSRTSTPLIAGPDKT